MRGSGLREELRCCVERDSSMHSLSALRNLSQVTVTSEDRPDSTWMGWAVGGACYAKYVGESIYLRVNFTAVGGHGLYGSNL